MSARSIILFAALSGFVAVAMGAAGAHALPVTLEPQALDWVRTAVRYQVWHALGLLAAGALTALRPGAGLALVAAAWIAGTVLFCGSLYLLALTGLRLFAHIAPFGGVAFLVGWLALAWYAVKARD